MQLRSERLCWFKSTIGRKQLVAVSGLGLSLFVLTHMLGNLLIFVGPRAYNEYSHNLVSNPFILAAEAGLLGLFLVHLGLAMLLTIKNWWARDSRYAMSASGDKATSAVQKSLWAQGLLMLIFVVLHLLSFKFGTYYDVDYGKGPIRDLHRLVVELFQRPEYVSGYVFALLVLGLHLNHGVGSSLQTLGVNHPRYNSKIKCLSLLYAGVVSAGFIAQPLYVYFIFRG